MEASFFVYLCPVVALLALIYAYMRAAWVKRQDPGNERMQMIGSWIADGAMAFLRREYRVLAIFVIAVAVLLGVSNYFVSEDTNALIALSFVLGAFCSALAGLLRHEDRDPRQHPHRQRRPQGPQRRPAGRLRRRLGDGAVGGRPGARRPGRPVHRSTPRCTPTSLTDDDGR